MKKSIPFPLFNLLFTILALGFLVGCVSSASVAEAKDGTKMKSRAFSVGSKTGISGAQSSQSVTAPDGTVMERDVTLDEVQTTSQAPEIMQSTGQLMGTALGAMFGSPAFWQGAGQVANSMNQREPAQISNQDPPPIEPPPLTAVEEPPVPAPELPPTSENPEDDPEPPAVDSTRPAGEETPIAEESGSDPPES